MTNFCFPDNTVLCNFASVSRMGLLEAILEGRGRWTEAVEYEVSRSAKVPDLTALDPEDMIRWLGDPIEVDDSDAVERIRVAAFGGVPADPLRHLGEAQTLHVISQWNEFKAATWISDDRASLDFARRKGIRVMETMDLMAEGCVNYHVQPAAAFALLQQMRANGNSLRIPVRASDLMR